MKPSLILCVLVASMACLALADKAPAAPACVATPGQNTAGPSYKPFQPTKNEVCAPAPPSEGPTHMYVVDQGWCHTWCWGRQWVEVKDINISLVGEVVEAGSCAPVKGARLEVWQADATGLYGVLDQGIDDGVCRAAVPADKDGKFEFTTQRAGTYGFFGAYGLHVPRGYLSPEYLIDLPPYSPRSIYMIVTAPGYKPITTQFYFAGDDTLKYGDYRVDMGGLDLGAMDKNLRLRFKNRKDANGYAQSEPVTLVLEKQTDPEGMAGHISENLDTLTRYLCDAEEILTSNIPTFINSPAVCAPWFVSMVSYHQPYLWVFIALNLLGYAYCAYGGWSQGFKKRGEKSLVAIIGDKVKGTAKVDKKKKNK